MSFKVFRPLQIDLEQKEGYFFRDFDGGDPDRADSNLVSLLELMNRKRDAIAVDDAGNVRL